jgi:hypothetical protein
MSSAFWRGHCPLALMVSAGRLPDQENELDAPTMLQASRSNLACSHHNVVTLDSMIARLT